MTNQKKKSALIDGEAPMLGLIHVEAGTKAMQDNDGYTQTTLVAICLSTSQILIDRRKGNTKEFDTLFAIAAEMDPEEADKILVGFTECSKRFQKTTLKRAGVPEELVDEMLNAEKTAMTAQMRRLLKNGTSDSPQSPEVETTRSVTLSA